MDLALLPRLASSHPVLLLGIPMHRGYCYLKGDDAGPHGVAAGYADAGHCSGTGAPVNTGLPSTCDLTANYDYAGFDLPDGMHLPATNAEGCALMCTQHKHCQYYTYTKW